MHYAICIRTSPYDGDAKVHLMLRNKPGPQRSKNDGRPRPRNSVHSNSTD